MEVQTSCSGSLNFYDSVAKAYNATKGNKSLDKVSFTDNEGMHRFCPKLKSELWNPKSEYRMNQLSKTYQFADDNDLFWVDQPMDKFCDLVEKKTIQNLLLKLAKDGFPIPDHMKEHEYLINEPLISDDDCYAGAIVSILTTPAFELKYNC